MNKSIGKTTKKWLGKKRTFVFWNSRVKLKSN